MNTAQAPKPEVVERDAGGTIFVSASLTHFRSDAPYEGVCVGASFAGIPTASFPLKAGCKGWIAHEAGPGLDAAGVSGVRLSGDLGVPAAAVATMQAELSGGASVLAAPISVVNAPARSLGVREGQTGLEAARLMLGGGVQRSFDVSDRFDASVRRVAGTEASGIYTAWSIGLVEGCRPSDVFCVASHGGPVMADYAAPVAPRGLIANDAGVGLNRSGIAGIFDLEALGTMGATVSTNSARIGDPTSTWEDGVISYVNALAREAGVAPGMSARQAAEIMLLS